MNDQFDVTGGVSEMAVSRQSLEHVEEDAATYGACTETAAHQQLTQSGETTEDQAGGNDALAVEQLSWKVSTVIPINTFPGCYDDDYYGNVQLI